MTCFQTQTNASNTIICGHIKTRTLTKPPSNKAVKVIKNTKILQVSPEVIRDSSDSKRVTRRPPSEIVTVESTLSIATLLIMELDPIVILAQGAFKVFMKMRVSGMRNSKSRCGENSNSSRAKNRNTTRKCDSNKGTTGPTIQQAKTNNGAQVPALQILSTHHSNNGCEIRG